jgi:hypothetical protein
MSILFNQENAHIFVSSTKTHTQEDGTKNRREPYSTCFFLRKHREGDRNQTPFSFLACDCR